MKHKQHVRLTSFLMPVMLFAALQLSGCTSEKPIPAATPGGTYISQTAGASYEQAVQIEGIAGEYIAQFPMVSLYRVPEKPATIIIAAGRKGVVISRDDGQNWQVIPPALTSTTDAIALSSGAYLIAGSGPKGEGYVLRSLDEGKSWQTVFTIPLTENAQQGFRLIGGSGDAPALVLSLKRDPFDGNRVYLGSNIGTVYLGEQSGKTWREWQTLTSSQQAISGGQLGIRTIIPSPYVAGEVLVITSDKQLLRLGNDGQQPIKVTLPTATSPLTFSQQEKVNNAVYVPNFPNALFVGTEKGVLVSRDLGLTWLELKVPLNTSASFQNMPLAISPSNPNRLFLAVGSIMYRSEDSGTTWNTYNLGLPNHTVSQISISPTNAARMIIVTQPIGS